MNMYLRYIILLCLTAGCAISEPGDCFQDSGDLTNKIVNLSDFSRVIVREGIALELVQGTENRLEIQYDEGLLDQITFEIIDGRLELNNTNGCSFFTGFKPAELRLSVVNLIEVRNASQYTIQSVDTLRFDSLTLISEDFLEDEVNVGDFNVVFKGSNLSIITNNVSNFDLSGTTDLLNLNIASGQGRLEAAALQARSIRLFHRGTSDLLVHPLEEIAGEIRGTGDVIAVNRPAVINVEELYTGRLVFRD